MVQLDLLYIFDTLDVDGKGFINLYEVKQYDELVYGKNLDFDQIEASIFTVCGKAVSKCCRKESFPALAKELERRHQLEESLFWDFKALDLDNTGQISLESALFLFKTVHGQKFSSQIWEEFLANRLHPDRLVCFHELRLPLCNIPEYEIAGNDDEYKTTFSHLEERSRKRKYDDHKMHKRWEEDEYWLAQQERLCSGKARKLKSSGDSLLNRMEEVGMLALLEEESDEVSLLGRPQERVSATDVLSALHEKYLVLREKLLREMLKMQIGSGMWEVLSESEQEERLQQVLQKEEKLRRDGKLESMAAHLPGAGSVLPFNLLKLMGESGADREKRRKADNQMVLESCLTEEEVEAQSMRRLKEKEKEASSSHALLIELNNRYKLEKEYFSARLQGLKGYEMMSSDQKEDALIGLVQMRLRGGQETRFASSAVGVGLSEHLRARTGGRENDEKQEELASARMVAYKDRSVDDVPVLPARLFQLKSKLGRVDIGLQIVQEVERRFALEREALMSWIVSKESVPLRLAVRKMTEEQRKVQLGALRSQHVAWLAKPASDRKSTSHQHHLSLQEAVPLKFESLKDEMRRTNQMLVEDLAVSSTMLARLQTKQDESCSKILNVGRKTRAELEAIWKEETQALVEEAFDNIASVLFDVTETSKEEDEVVDALKSKYDALRDKLLLEALVNQMGKAEWDRLNERERQNRLAKMKLLAKKLQQEGRYDELAKLMGDAGKNSETLGRLLGESRLKHQAKLDERLKHRQRKMNNGEDPDEVDDTRGLEESPPDLSGDLLKDLEKRFQEERDELLGKLREQDNRLDSERLRQAEIARLRLEARRAGREANFDSAALVIGLAERNRLAAEERLKKDQERQKQLARERLHARTKRKSLAADSEDGRTDPGKDDVPGWIDAVVKEMGAKHEQERDLFMDLLQDESCEDLRQEARDMTAVERDKRLKQLKAKREELDFGDGTDQEDHLSILEMAASFKLIHRSETMMAQRVHVDLDEIVVSLLADLQLQQDLESNVLVSNLPGKNQEELCAMRNRLVEERKHRRADNVAAVIFRYDGETQDDQLMQAVDKKYDALLEKLSVDVLRRQIGDGEWMAMLAKARKARALKLMMEIKKLANQEKLNEIERLVSVSFSMDRSLPTLMGPSKDRCRNICQDRKTEAKADRKTRLSVSSKGLEDALPNQRSEDIVSIIKSISSRCEEEKKELIRCAEGETGAVFGEAERQSELLHLKYEQRRCLNEPSFLSAIIAVGLSERNQSTIENRVYKDEERQLMLATERILHMGSGAHSPVEEVVASRHADSLEDSVIRLMLARHHLERQQLLHVLKNRPPEEDAGAMVKTQLSREQQLLEIRQQCLTVSQGDKDEYLKLVAKAASLSFHGRKDRLQSVNKEKRVSDDDVCVSLMADLQKIQDGESWSMLSRLPNKDELVTLQSSEAELRRKQIFPNVQQLLCVGEPFPVADDAALLKMLESKYDAVKDKLILDALEKQMGAAEWARKSERDRQQELVKFKLDQRRLVQTGKEEEAKRVLQNLLQQGENASALFGDSRLELQRRVQERLALRQQRKAAGLSEERISQMETEEDKLYEDSRRKSPGDILQNLEKNFEVERDALMQLLSEQDSIVDRERIRQMEALRLRREAKKALAEEKFDAAALVLGLAKSQHDALTSKMQTDRWRQEQLARQRLQVLKDRRQATSKLNGSEQTMGVGVEPSTTDDRTLLQDIIMMEVEGRHATEREVLEKLMRAAQSSESVQAARQLSSKEREIQLLELQLRRNKWREEAMESPDEQMKIFEAAIPLKMECFLSGADRIRAPTTSSVEEAMVKLLADLQEVQDRQSVCIMRDVQSKDAADLKQLIRAQQSDEGSMRYDNIASVLLGGKTSSSAASNDADACDLEIDKAIKEKYDAMKEKIYIQALKSKFGESEWENMPESVKREHLARMLAEAELDSVSKDVESALESVALPDIDALLGTSCASQEGLLMGKIGDANEHHRSTDLPRVKASQVLSELQNQYEAERDAILAMLASSDSHEMSERQRQLAIARLRREKQKIRREANYDGAALLMQRASEQRADKLASVESERARQEKIARDRIETRRRQAKDGPSKNEKDRVLEEERLDQVDDLKQVAKIQDEGVLALQDAVLNEIEKKHESECDLLLELVQAMDASRISTAASGMVSDDEQYEALLKASMAEQSWRDRSKRLLEQQSASANMTEAQHALMCGAIAEGRAEHASILAEGLSHVLVGKVTRLRQQGVAEEKIKDECLVLIMADLQEKQTAETNAMMRALTQADDAAVEKLKEYERGSRRAGWMDNLVAVLFAEVRTGNRVKISAEEKAKDLEEAEIEIKVDTDAQLAVLEKEIEAEKKKQLHGLNEKEMANALERLNRQLETKKQAIQEQAQRQRDVALRRLEERRRKLEDKQYEEDVAAALMAASQRRSAMLREKTMAVQGAQKDSLDERLRQRRENRMRAQFEQAERVEQANLVERTKLVEQAKRLGQVDHEHAAKSLAYSQEVGQELKGHEKALDEAKLQAVGASYGSVDEDFWSTGFAAAKSLPDSSNVVAGANAEMPTETRKADLVSPLPGGGLRREKTVVDEAADMSEMKKKAMITSLMREQTNAALKMQREQTRQEELVRSLRDNRRKKMEAREEEAAAVLGLGERQKTVVEDKKKGERERQITQIRDRVNRIKFERTMTMKEPRGDSTRGFTGLLSGVDAELTEDERMQQIAKEMERKFKEGVAQEELPGSPFGEQEHASLHSEDSARSSDRLGYAKLDDKAREQILKERQKEKRRRRKEVDKPPANSDVDEGAKLAQASGGDST